MSNPLQIILNVYDLHESNRVLYNMGVGFFHTGVEINGYEFSFSNQGVVRTRPRLPEFGVLREQLPMGAYNEGMQGIYAVISTLRNRDFQPGAYHPTNLNCNHFTDSFCVAVVGQHIPNWINRAAGIGSTMAATRTDASNNKSSSTAEALPALGVVRAPSDPVKNTLSSSIQTNPTNQTSSTKEDTSIVTSIFSWFGYNSTENTANSSHTTTATTSTSGVADTKTANVKTIPSSAKKELTAKQKELLAKMKA